MKWKSKICICLAVLLVLGNCPVLGAEFDAGYEFEENTVQWKFSGGNGGEYLNISILPADLDVTSITAGELTGCENLLLKTAVVQSDGSGTGRMRLPDAFADGRYYIHALWNEGSACCILVKPDFAELETLAARLNEEEQQTFELLEEYNTLFEQDNQYFALYGEEIVAFVAGQMPVQGYRAETLLDSRLQGEGLALVRGEAISMAEMLRLYAGYFPDTVTALFEAATPAVQQKAAELLKKQEIEDIPFEENFDSLLLLAEALTCTSAETLQGLILEKYQEYGIDLQAYQELRNTYYQNRAFQELYRQLSGIESVGALRDAFHASVQMQADTSEPNQGGSSGGGRVSGSGGSSGIFQPAAASPAPTATALIASPVPAALSDIQGHWAEADIRQLLQEGAVRGYEDGTFRPDHSVTRAEFVQIVCNALQLEESGEAVQFLDVRREDWFYPAVSTAVQAGLVQGISETAFAPNQEISREDAAVILYRVCGDIPAEAEPASFSDMAEVADYAHEAVEKLTAAQILLGEDGRFWPKRSVTRAEAASLILRVRNAAERGNG